MRITISIICSIVLIFISCNPENNPTEETLGENNIVDLGLVDAALLEENGEFDFRKTGEPSRTIKFSLNRYSRLNLDLSGFDGSFSLFSITENRFLSHDGGSLGGGNFNLGFFQGYNFITELFAGEYKISVNADSSNFEVDAMVTGTYSLRIEDIDNLKPYKDLGALELPYNGTFEADDQRLSNTLYEFEILEDTDITVFVNGDVCPLDPFAIQTYLFNANGERIENDLVSNVLLPRGSYRLFFNGTRTLILNGSDKGDVDFGVVTDFPKNLEVDLDMTYEPDFQRKFYFEITEEVTIEGFDTITADFQKFLYNSSEEPLNISSPSILQPGKYFIYFETDGFAYGNCNQEYRIINASEVFVLSKS